MPRASIKANAKESLRGNWGTAILVLLLNWMLLSAATGVMVIGKLIIMGTLETGVALIYLKLSYREPAEIGDLFQPFQNFVNTFFAGFLSTIFTFLWSLLFVIPASSRRWPIPRSIISCVTIRNTPVERLSTPARR